MSYIFLATSWWGRHYFPILQIAKLGRESVRNPPCTSRQRRSGQKKHFPPLQLLLLPQRMAVTLRSLLPTSTWKQAEVAGHEHPDSNEPRTVAITELMCRRLTKEVQTKAQLWSVPSSKSWPNLELDLMPFPVSQSEPGLERGNHLRIIYWGYWPHTRAHTHISPAMLGPKNIYRAVNELYICVC